jgi:hypothetical protein
MPRKRWGSRAEAEEDLRQIAAGFRGINSSAMRWLGEFCRAKESTFHPNERVSSRLDGRREVYLLIELFQTLPPHELFDALGGREPPPPDEDEL